MKKILIYILVMLFALNLEAQWYERKYGADSINDLSKIQLTDALQQFEKNIKTGKTIFWCGIYGELLGWGLLGMAFWLDSDSEGLAYIVVPLILGCPILTLVGIPIWAVNASRRNKIELALVKFNTSSLLGDNANNYFGYKQPSTFGLSMKVSF